jgi:esterase/lipase superfamily enzyme
MVATSRAKSDRASEIFGSRRAPAMNFAEIGVSVPANHKPGEVEIPRRGPANPNSHFGVTNSRMFDSDLAFSARIAERALALDPSQREAVVFVHGFNNTFPEALYRFAQMTFDFRVSGIPVLYSWPSGGDAKTYLYDRDSVLFARDGLEQMLDRLENSQVSRIQIIAHSMGSQLVVEAMRQKAIRTGRKLWSKLDGVVLISPDIDVDVFASMAAEIGELPQPFVVMTSERDRALQLSEFLADGRARLGTETNSAVFDTLPITVIDTSAEGTILGTNHMTGVSSPAMIAFLRGLRDSRITQTVLAPEGPRQPGFLAGLGAQ